MLRKIIAICLRERIIDRVDAKIPLSQAAYRSGRSTTEHVFATKMMVEKSISSTNHVTHVLMLDMSKAFDTVDRTLLLRDLSTVIENDELHLVSLLLDTKLMVQCGSSTSEFFETNTGVPQGDSLSANQFTFYLAQTLMERETLFNNQIELTITQQNDMVKVNHDHSYAKEIDNSVNINQEYADDMSTISTNINNIEHMKQIIPPMLLNRNLKINESKTEQYTIKRKGETDWKKCKLLGSLLDTNSDIQRRKSLAIGAANSMHTIFNRKMSLLVKIRAFKCYVESIFLYNSELWTLNATLEKSIDSFHRRLLRKYVLNITYPRKMRNDDVYSRTEVVPWSRALKRRQLSWFGHLMRLPDDTPAKLSLNHFLNHETTKPRGRQMTTWFSMMKKRFLESNMTWEQASLLAGDRIAWNQFMSSFRDDEN